MIPLNNDKLFLLNIQLYLCEKLSPDYLQTSADMKSLGEPGVYEERKTTYKNFQIYTIKRKHRKCDN